MTDRITVVVPTYNEKANLPELVAQLLALPLPELRILVVDDNSPDGTGGVADALASDSHGRLEVLHRTAKDGLGRAYIAGMTRALDDGADVVVQMDADLSHPVSAIPAMVAALREPGVGVVLGSRYVPGGSTDASWPWRRRLLSRWANAYVNAVLRLGVKDATSGFKAWRAATLELIDLETVQSSGYSFQTEMNCRARAWAYIAEVPIHFTERAEGVSKMSMAVQLESMLMPWRLRLGKC